MESTWLLPLQTVLSNTMRTALVSLLAAFIFQQVLAQDEEIISIGPDIVLDNIHNVSSIEGTWSSGSQKVLTGPVCSL